MEIRKSQKEDLPRIMEIYSHARSFMASHGNPNQWGPSNWPPEELIIKDIKEEKSYVCVDEERIIGTFFYDYGYEAEKTYLKLDGGQWKNNGAYGVVHRIASDGTKKGTGEFCLNWAYGKCNSLRIDTHEDNVVMQNLLKKLSFEKRGIIYLEDKSPRWAYEK